MLARGALLLHRLRPWLMATTLGISLALAFEEARLGSGVESSRVISAVGIGLGALHLVATLTWALSERGGDATSTDGSLLVSATASILIDASLLGVAFLYASSLRVTLPDLSGVRFQQLAVYAAASGRASHELGAILHLHALRIRRPSTLLRTCSANSPRSMRPESGRSILLLRPIHRRLYMTLLHLSEVRALRRLSLILFNSAFSDLGVCFYSACIIAPPPAGLGVSSRLVASVFVAYDAAVMLLCNLKAKLIACTSRESFIRLHPILQLMSDVSCLFVEVWVLSCNASLSLQIELLFLLRVARSVIYLMSYPTAHRPRQNKTLNHAYHRSAEIEREGPPDSLLNGVVLRDIEEASSECNGSDSSLRGWRRRELPALNWNRASHFQKAMSAKASLGGAWISSAKSSKNLCAAGAYIRRRATSIHKLSKDVVDYDDEDEDGQTSGEGVAVMDSMADSVKAQHKVRLSSVRLSTSEQGERPLRILAIDGGGIKGFNALESILEIEKRCGLPISDLFDLIVGTSIGGAIAMTLMTRGPDGSSACGRLLESLASDVLSKGSLFNLMRLGHKIQTNAVDKFAQKAYGEMNVQGDSRMPPALGGRPGEGKRRPHCALTSAFMEKNQWCCMLLCNYDRPDHEGDHRMVGSNQWEVGDILRASTAAPTYFQPVTVDGRTYVDGGLAANNPTMHAILEAGCIWPQRRIGCVVSLGCGKSSYGGAKSSGTLYWVSQLMAIAVSTEKVHESVRALTHNLNINYWRIDPDEPSGDAALDESSPGRITAMRQATREYLQSNSAELDQMCLALLQLTWHPSAFSTINSLLKKSSLQSDVQRAMQQLIVNHATQRQLSE